MKFEIKEEDLNKLINNQLALQGHVNSNKFLLLDALIDRFSTAIFVECAEAIAETNFKWWKAVKVDVDKLKEELADVFIFALDFAILSQGVDSVSYNFSHPKFEKEVIDNANYDIMITKLKIIGSIRYASVYQRKYGIEVMNSIIEVANMYGYTDIMDIIIKKQDVNVQRQLDGYNKLKEEK